MARLRRLSVGVKGLDVERLQLQLNKFGFQTPVTGVFTDKTRLAVLLCQRKLKIEASGAAGYEFQDRLNELVPDVSVAQMSAPPPREKVVSPIKISELREYPTAPRIALKPDPPSIEKQPDSPSEPSFSQDYRVLAIVVGNLEHIQALVKQLSDAMPCRWGLLAITKDELKNKVEGSMEFLSEVKPKSSDPAAQWSQGLATAWHFTDTCHFTMPCTTTGTTAQRILKLIPAMLSHDAQIAIGTWFDADLNESIPVGRSSILEGRVNLNSCLVKTSILANPPIDSSLGDDQLSDLFLKWHLHGERFAFVTGAAVFSGSAAAATATWASHRDGVIASLWHRPKISALMLTGKCVERYALAKVAVQCFFDQTWPNKELVIVNHGSVGLSDQLPQCMRSFVRELRFDRPETMTIGEMRNLSMDMATGDWMIQWDDDDWHHPLRMETQFSRAEPGTINTLNWQVRCNIESGSAFYDKMTGGQHMSVLYPRTENRYAALNAREDTRFFESFKRMSSIDNAPDNTPIDPLLYIRFFHGRNIWGREHIMGGSEQDRNDRSIEVELGQYHTEQLRHILQTYTESTQRLNVELAIAGHKEWDVSQL